MSSQVLWGIKIYQTLNANSVVLARKFNKSKSKFWHHVIALPRKISKIYLQVFFPFSFHQIEDLRCSNCVSYGTKHSSLQIEPWSPPHWILLIFYCWSVMVGTLCMGTYYVLNTYYVLYFTYNTLHTYRAKQGCTQLYTAIHCYTQLYTAIQS